MDLSADQQRPPDATSQSPSNELVKLIGKLRWMGMEEEAVRLQNELTRRATAADDSVLAVPGDTD